MTDIKSSGIAQNNCSANFFLENPIFGYETENGHHNLYVEWNIDQKNSDAYYDFFRFHFRVGIYLYDDTIRVVYYRRKSPVTYNYRGPEWDNHHILEILGIFPKKIEETKETKETKKISPILKYLQSPECHPYISTFHEDDYEQTTDSKFINFHVDSTMIQKCRDFLANSICNECQWSSKFLELNKSPNLVIFPIINDRGYGGMDNHEERLKELGLLNDDLSVKKLPSYNFLKRNDLD